MHPKFGKWLLQDFCFLPQTQYFAQVQKTNSCQRCLSTTRMIGDEFRVKKWSDKELAVESQFWPTLEHCGQLQKFCGTLADQHNIASGHIYNMQFDLPQNIVWFMRCEQHKVTENPTLGSKSPFLAILCYSHLMNQTIF